MPGSTSRFDPERTNLDEAMDRTEHASAWNGRDFRDDKPHAALQAPHFDMETYAAQAGRKPGRQESVFGQLLAYLGVGLLTIGTALVVWGYFGGEAVQRYQSTGWLVSTAGQMLLFLGVVTLVSGGMQQTTHEVAQRVEYLGGKMHRIEQSQQELLEGAVLREGTRSRRCHRRTMTTQRTRDSRGFTELMQESPGVATPGLLS